MFSGMHKGKKLNICTSALLWKGEFLGVKDDLVTLSKATAISVSSGIEIVSEVQIYVDIPLAGILSVSVGELKVNRSSPDSNAELAKLNHPSSSVTINKDLHILKANGSFFARLRITKDPSLRSG